MTPDRTCTDCGGTIAYTRGRPAVRCGECARGRRRVKQRSTVVCQDCSATFAPAGHTGAPPRRCEPCREAHQRDLNAAKQRRWRAANQEAAKGHSVASWARRAKDPAFKHSRWVQTLAAKYGLTEADYAALLARQGGTCAICSGGPTGQGSRLYVDHCHATSKVRGLLCSNCNTMLGLAGDSPQVLSAAIAYLATDER